MKVFVTGATGFVGHHVAKALAAEGADLRLLVRKTSNLANLEGIRGETYVGDLADPESLRPRSQTATPWSTSPPTIASGFPILRPCTAPTSTARASCSGWPARQASGALSTHRASPPCTSDRWDCDQRRHAGLARRHGGPLPPVQVHGGAGGGQRREERPAGHHPQSDHAHRPQRRKPTPTGRIFVDFLNGKFPAYVDTGLNLVDVAEVARAHVLALTKGTPGHRYILGGENLTLKQILDKMSAITGIPSPTVKIPFAIAATYAFFEEWITGRIRGREPRATLEEVRMGRKKMFSSSAHAEQELGFRILPVYPAMRAAIEWFCDHGYAPATTTPARA